MPNPDPRESTRDTHFTVTYSVENGGKKKEEAVTDGPVEDDKPVEGEDAPKDDKPFPPKKKEEGEEEDPKGEAPEDGEKPEGEFPPKKEDKPEAEAPAPEGDEEDEEEDPKKGKNPFPPKKRSGESVKDIYRAASAPVEVRNEDGDTLHGYFSVFNNPYRISSFWEGDFYEKVEPGAFSRAIKERGNSIRVLLEHGFDPQVGNKTLGKMQKVSEDSRGGSYEAKLYTEASYVKDLLPGLRNGDYEASFRFRVREEHWDYDPERTDWNPEGLPVRTLKDVDVLEVGPCLFGANPEASSGVRSRTDQYRAMTEQWSTELARGLREANESMHDTSNEASRKVAEEPQSAPAKKAAEKPEEVRQEDESGEETRTEDSTPDTTTASEKGQAKMPKSLNERRAELQAMQARRDAISDAAGEYELTAEARAEYDKLGTDAEALKASIEFDEKRLEDVRARQDAGTAERGVGGAKVTDPATYRNTHDGHAPSYFKDLWNGQRMGDNAALERLRRNNMEARAGMTTTDGAGGEFVPPLWMVNEYIELAKAARVVADNVTKKPLPANTDSLSLPTVATGPSVAEHATQNAAISETDMTSSSVTAKTHTLAGGQTVAIELLEQSPINIDQVVLPELAKELAVQIDTFVINNNAANKRGLLNVSGNIDVTYTDATPTVGELYSKLSDCISQIHTNRFLSPTKIFMHPRRWAWMTAALDTTNRPLVLPSTHAPQNVIAAAGGLAAEGFVGTTGHGLPVFVDPNIPTNLGAGTNEDVILVVKHDDPWLFEGTPKAQAFEQTKADTMSVFFRLYNYVMLHSERYPKSIANITGTGLVAPTF